MSVYDGPLATDLGNMFSDEESRSRRDVPSIPYAPVTHKALPDGHHFCHRCYGVYLVAATSNPAKPTTLVDPVTLRPHRITCERRQEAWHRAWRGIP